MGCFKTGLAVIGGTIIIGAVVWHWDSISTWIRTGARVAGDAAHSSVPTGFEIERIQTMVGDLDDVIFEQRARLAEQQVDLEYLTQDVERSNQRVAELTTEVAEARRVLSVQRTSYRISGREFAHDEVIAEASSRVEALERAREIAAAKQATRDTLAAALRDAEQHLMAAERQRETYAMQLSELRAKAETVAMRQELATNLDQVPGLDTGAFQDVEAAFRRVERDLAVQERVLEERGGQRATPRIDFAAPEADEDVLARIDAALGFEPPADVTPAVAMIE